MNNSVKIIEKSNPNFDEYWDRLCESSLINPTYSSYFLPYYLKYFKDNEYEDLRHLALIDNNPVLGLAMVRRTNQSLDLSYFEMPIKLIINPEANDTILRLADDSLLMKVIDLGIGKEINQSNSKFIYSETSTLNHVSKIGKFFLKSSSKVKINFEQFIDLNLEYESIYSNFSKSVKSAIRQKVKNSLELKIINQYSGRDSILSTFESLRMLHLLAAGMITRSDESWNEQVNQVILGNAFLTVLFQNSNVLGAALFFLSKSSAYYALSAKDQISDISISHLLVSEGIFYAKKLDLHRLYLGPQFTNKIEVVDSKIESIEKFKSFFGGDYSYSFIAIQT